MARFIEEGRRQLSQREGAEEKLKHIVQLHLTLLGEDRDLAVIFQVELRHSLHFLQVFSRSRIREYLEIIAQVVLEGQREGAFRRGLDPLLTAKAIFGVLDEITTDWILSQRNLRLAQKSAAVAELILGGLQEATRS
jgi:TetR/AcrR family fatty acid metabolism transcriptional regulator